MANWDPDYCPDGEMHDWQPDTERRGWGYICSRCLVSEAEVAPREESRPNG